MMEEKYSKEFIDAYKERIKRIKNGETFEYPDIFSSFTASSACSPLKDLHFNYTYESIIGKPVIKATENGIIVHCFNENKEKK